ncbi:DUF2891 domain-containing protein [Rhodopirellula sp. JC740]|uniref:DUF2891 domain-containing protein n=1 Tax=Rhodopirellula halodulae TaxID=2894198 RepID=A0ABS8NL08_9BACT|nr:DUF2891 domain-containing protein [Rhodopirellula sp. JC740]MCC9644238.1 DUF2891 domain-containing protein [Rhodopirellula sp. JC740]
MFAWKDPFFRQLFSTLLLGSVMTVPAWTQSPDGNQSVEQDSNATIVLTSEMADQWAELVLHGVDTEFPNKLSLVYSNADQIGTPKEHFPAFYGCFDWHSSVHGHWVLVRLLKLHPEMESASRIRATLSRHLKKENLEQETEFFARDENKTFERMYGWAWFLRLAMELETFEDDDAKRWRASLAPLESLLVQRIQAYLPLLTFPIRTGQHPDTGFALGQVLDYAKLHGLTDLEALVVERATDFYSKDVAYPLAYEPSGHDFFSSGWNEADLMRRVLPAPEFANWLTKLMPDLVRQLGDGTVAPVGVSDLTDGKLVHLAGLNLNRAWCLQSVAEHLPDSDPRVPLLRRSAADHLTAGLSYINSGHYEGDHWLATFGLYTISGAGR